MNTTESLWSPDRFTQLGLKPPTTRARIPVGPQDVATVLDAALAEKPDAVAMIGRHRRLTFAALDCEANAAAACLLARGIGPGDRIAASAGNHPDIVTAFLAAQRIGAIWLGLNRNLSAGEKRYMIDDATPRLILAEEAVLPSLPAAVPVMTIDPRGGEWNACVQANIGAGRPGITIDPWAPAGIAYTSGTTGRPKGAVHSQHNMLVAATIAALVNGDPRAEAVRGTASPLTILNMMIGGPVSALSTGNPHVCMDRIDVAGLAEWIAREKVNTLALVPTLIQDLLTSPDIAPGDLASLTWIVVGAAMVPEGMTEVYEARFGHKPTIGYGLTENPTVVSRTHDRTPMIQGAIGRPMRHLDVAILDEDGQRLPAGQSGEIAIRAITQGEWANVYTPALGYWNRPDATEELLRDGWLHTGDIGSFDTDGELFIHARRNDLIVRGGSNIYPAEIERVIRLDPRVIDCAVLGKPDARLGEVPVAFVQLAPGCDEASVFAALRDRATAELARYKLPADWKAIDAMPRNAMGKIVKNELKPLID